MNTASLRILYVSRSRIQAVTAEERVSVEGEAFRKGYGSPSFLAYPKTLMVTQDDGALLQPDEQTSRELMFAIVEAMRRRGQTVEIES